MCYVTRRPVNNASVRERFGIPDSVTASRLLKEAIDGGMLTVRDASVGTRNRTYLPFWAA